MANYDIRKIKLGRCYFINELATFGIERRTFYRWRKKGLKVIGENEKHLLVKGIDLINFDKTKKKTEICISCFNLFISLNFCLGCFWWLQPFREETDRFEARIVQ